jgi:hypothetical protein
MLGAPSGMPFAGAMTVGDIDYQVQIYSDASSFMKSVGFDAADIHFGHGYGLSQFISPRTNKRTDEYGGSLTNRMRLPLRVLEAVKQGRCRLQKWLHSLQPLCEPYRSTGRHILPLEPGGASSR